MKSIIALLLSFLLLWSCSRTVSSIKIGFENNSASNEELTFLIFINNSFFDSVKVKRKLLSEQFKWVTLPLSSGDKFLNIKFVVREAGKTMEYDLNKDSINQFSFLHVNYVEMLFKKGDSFYSEVLSKDSIVYTSFYCKLLSNRRSN